MNTAQTSSPLIASGKLKGIAVASRVRSAVLPDIRTMHEQGVAGYDASQWRGFLAPARTPPAIVNRLNQEFVAALKSQEVAGMLEKVGRRAVGSSPDNFKAYIVEDIARWKNLVQNGDIELTVEDAPVR